jgi:hypothetical protein
MYAQDCGLFGDKCLVLWAIIFDKIILEHYQIALAKGHFRML